MQHPLGKEKLLITLVGNLSRESGTVNNNNKKKKHPAVSPTRGICQLVKTYKTDIFKSREYRNQLFDFKLQSIPCCEINKAHTFLSIIVSWIGLKRAK